MKVWLQTAMLPGIRKRCLKTALIVGTLLMLINYYDRLMIGQLLMTDLIKIALTYCVPFVVCTTASVSAVLEKREQRSNPVHKT
ncbi:nitrate/nitrite transporter NrtS [Maritalea myrionectae]|uniref:nitrate/nitrite transporter NrtS n=1 Tax=Maritalea myrionectae TaxID=454601 RepID=UPI0004006701|nr:nitrate/nitrite transporter NrtS [Maritalea myrionectae]